VTIVKGRLLCCQPGFGGTTAPPGSALLNRWVGAPSESNSIFGLQQTLLCLRLSSSIFTVRESQNERRAFSRTALVAKTTGCRVAAAGSAKACHSAEARTCLCGTQCTHARTDRLRTLLVKTAAAHAHERSGFFECIYNIIRECEERPHPMAVRRAHDLGVGVR
jgi:hypothetical protein